MSVAQETVKVFTVWGPTAEWGDGFGPLAYFPTIEGAELFVEGEQASVRDADMQDSWPYNQVDYSIEEQRLEDVVPEEEVEGIVNDWDEDEFFDYLNQN